MKPAALASILIFHSACALAAYQSSFNWDPPKPVGPDTTFFNEAPREKKDFPGNPLPGDKGYAWHCLERGNDRMLAKEYEQAAAYFRAAYEQAGPERVLAGFRLVEAYEKLARVDTALDLVDQMERKYLASPREFQEAQRWRTELLDLKRKGAEEPKPAPFTGREWLMQLSEWRLRYVLDAMDELRKHGVPVEDSAQHYVFKLDEYFVAHPETPAVDAASTLAGVIYENDPRSRIPIDRWRQNPDIAPEAPSAPLFQPPKKITGTEWITLVQNDKLDYVAGAMKLLRDQHVPMEKSLYAYVDALDKLFTEMPGLPASDSVVALASVLYQTEPEARKILEALRLQ